MSARNSAKAIVLNEGKILVNRCVSRFGDYYALPGGGQRDNETLLEAVKRELLEETGHAVIPIRLAGVYERLCENRADGSCHKIYFIFLCKLANGARATPTEQDRFQVGMEWVEARELRRKNLFPRAIRDNLAALTCFGETIYLGSEREK